ncbi:MAG TPA: RNA degradosome polyphosphate kinase [Candidatus Alistipes merdigallinarum]|nr:RNA degradosome polyphosphate kinase [Candidatus Alistipes merdigallinarum]
METGKLLDRDLSWMYFNHRILQEAQRENVPLLERLKFLGIYSNNLDEFFRVRVSTMKRMAEYHSASQSPVSAAKELREITELTRLYSEEFDETFDRLKERLKEEHIHIIDESQLTSKQQQYIRMVYQNDLNSATYPLIMTQGSQLNELTDSSIYLCVKMARYDAVAGRSVRDLALIELPTKEFDRFIVLPSENDEISIIFLDDVVRFCLPFIFAGLGYESFEAYTLKFTRDAELELDGDIDEALVEKVARGVRRRRKGEPIRLVYDRNMPEEMLRYLKLRFMIDRYDACVGGSRYHNMKDLMSFPDCGRRDLKFADRDPVPVPALNTLNSSLDLIRRHDFFLHYPYHSFSNYIKILREAALSRDVHSIKTTVYRLAKNSKVVKALICAAKHGKRVTVMVELLARFDETSNINWSKKMQDAGIQVFFGIEGLKVHCKLTHIGSSKGDVACISTGNFHEGNARSYTDITLMTADKNIVREVDQVFEFIRQPYKTITFEHLIVSPQQMRTKLFSLIDKEIENAIRGKMAYIMCKVNHITDPKMVQRLYDASAAGVDVRLLVRGNCSLVSGQGVLSDRIEIRGIIDRYLEHARILIFCNGGDERYYIGSADWMPRNLDSRIEVYAPVYDPKIQAELKRIVEYGLEDNQAARIVDGTGANRLYDDGRPPFRSQEQLDYYYREEFENRLNDK